MLACFRFIWRSVKRQTPDQIYKAPTEIILSKAASMKIITSKIFPNERKFFKTVHFTWANDKTITCQFLLMWEAQSCLSQISVHSVWYLPSILGNIFAADVFIRHRISDFDDLHRFRSWGGLVVPHVTCAVNHLTTLCSFLECWRIFIVGNS